jgi:hypothetical protein
MVSLSLSLSLSLSFCENDTREPRDVREGEIREIRFILEIHICLLFIVLLPKVTVHDMFFNHAFSLPRGLFAELLSRKIAIAQINKIRAPPRRIHDGMPDGNSCDIKKERKKGVRERERERERKGKNPKSNPIAMHFAGTFVRKKISLTTNLTSLFIDSADAPLARI